jgi:hypothetical protein
MLSWKADEAPSIKDGEMISESNSNPSARTSLAPDHRVPLQPIKLFLNYDNLIGRS